MPRLGKQPRSKAKHERILEAATRHFAEHGYEHARIEDLADELGIAKGSIFQHFGSKKRLLLEAFRRTHLTHRTYLDAPPEVVKRGFFAIVRFWLGWADRVSSEDRTSLRLWIVANYATGLDVKREISRMFRKDDPTGGLSFVRMGVESGEVRDDIDPRLLAKTLDLLVNSFIEARFAEELDPGLVRDDVEPADVSPDRADQYLELIRGAVGARRPASR